MKFLVSTKEVLHITNVAKLVCVCEFKAKLV